jgi:hypothetical protein
MTTSSKLIFYIVTLILLLNSCTNARQQNDEPKQPHEKYYRAQEGGSVFVNIDTTTSLENLIKKLSGNWQLIETGKGYWIGYSDDMFSIAAHKDGAIKPLVSYFNSTNSNNAKTGVIYSLHLIGIESKIVGRFVENFKDTSARQALLNLAYHKEYTSLIISLLARDPWKSDLPTLTKLLESNSINLELINALFRYTKDDFPFRQTISESLDTINIFLQDSTGITKIGKLVTTYREKKGDDFKKVNNMKNVVVQWGDSLERIFRKLVILPGKIKKVQDYFNCSKSQLEKGSCQILNDLLLNCFLLSKDKVNVFSFDHQNNDKFQYYVDNSNLIICTAQQTRLRWLDYLQKKDF